MDWVRKFGIHNLIHVFIFFGMAFLFVNLSLNDSELGLRVVGYKHFGQIMLVLGSAIVAPLIVSTIAISVLRVVGFLIFLPLVLILDVSEDLLEGSDPKEAALDVFRGLGGILAGAWAWLCRAVRRPKQDNWDPVENRDDDGIDVDDDDFVELQRAWQIDADTDEDERGPSPCAEIDQDENLSYGSSPVTVEITLGDRNEEEGGLAGPGSGRVKVSLGDGEAGGRYASVAEQLLTCYTDRHITGDADAVVLALKAFLLPRRRTLFEENKPLAAAARILVDCKDTPEIREWSVDLLGRVGCDDDIPQIVTMANDDPDAKVRQEATAALGKYVRFRDVSASVKAEIKFLRDETDEKVLRAREMVVSLL